MNVNENPITQFPQTELKRCSKGGVEANQSTLIKKTGLVALFIFAGMALGAGIGVATAGVGFVAISIGVGSGAVAVFGLLLLAKIVIAFIQNINKKTPHEQLSAAAVRLNDYFHNNPDWFTKEKIFAEHQLNIPLPYNYTAKEKVKKELMSSNSPLLVELSKSVCKKNNPLILNAIRAQSRLVTLCQVKENQPYIVADILKELYREMNFFGDNFKIDELKKFGKTLSKLDMEREDMDEDVKWELKSLVDKILAPNQKKDFENFIRLLSKVNKVENNRRISSLSSMATKILCDHIYDQKITNVVHLLIKHSDILFDD